MAVTEGKEGQGKESRTRATRCGQRHELVSGRQIRRSRPGSTRQLRPNGAPRRGPASRWQPDSGLREGAVTARGRDAGRGHPPSFSARAAATTRLITRCSAPRRPAAALLGPPPRPAAGSRPAAEAAAAPAAPPARFPIPAGRGPPRSESGAALLGEAAAAARAPCSGLGQRRRGRERLRAQGFSSGRGSGPVCAWERACQSRPRPPHRKRGGEAERRRVRHGGRPYWRRVRPRLRAQACEGRGAALGTAPPSPGAAGRLSPGRRGPDLLVRLSQAHGSPASGAGTAQPKPVRCPQVGGERRPGAAARTYDGGARFAEAVTSITWRPAGLAAQPPWDGGGAAGAERRGAGEAHSCADAGPVTASATLQCGSLQSSERACGPTPRPARKIPRSDSAARTAAWECLVALPGGR